MWGPRLRRTPVTAVRALGARRRPRSVSSADHRPLVNVLRARPGHSPDRVALFVNRQAAASRASASGGSRTRAPCRRGEPPGARTIGDLRRAHHANCCASGHSRCGRASQGCLRDRHREQRRMNRAMLDLRPMAAARDDHADDHLDGASGRQTGSTVPAEVLHGETAGPEPARRPSERAQTSKALAAATHPRRRRSRQREPASAGGDFARTCRLDTSAAETGMIGEPACQVSRCVRGPAS